MNHPPPRRASVPGRITALFLLPVACGLAAVQTAGDPPGSYRLFMGSNFSIAANGTELPVKDVKNNAFVVDGPRGRTVVPLQDGQYKLRIEDALKLTTAFAVVDQLTVDRAYAPGHDPMQNFAVMARASAHLADSVDVANASVQGAEANVNLATASLQASNPDTAAMLQANLGNAQDQLATAQAAADKTQAMAGSELFSTLPSSSRMQSEITAGQFDAFKATFELSSARPLRTPYVVIVMRYLEAKSRPDTARTCIYAEKLPDIDGSPRKISIFRGGFPPGFQIDSYHLHLYEGGTEIATSVSRKQVALTTDQAFQYAVIQHVSDHRGQTKAPVKAGAFWPGDLASRVHPDKLIRTVFVAVDKNGKAAGIFEDDARHAPVSDPEIAALAPELRFFPALAKGKPVEGIAAVKLGPAD